MLRSTYENREEFTLSLEDKKRNLKVRSRIGDEVPDIMIVE